MTILDVCVRTSLVIGLDVPSQVFASTDREMLELARLANEIAERIQDSYNWQELLVMRTETGDGVSETFDLPADYAQMYKTSSMWSSRWTWALNQIPDVDTWLEYQVVPYTFVNGNWIIYGNRLHVLPIMANTETLKYWYVSKNKVTAADTSTKEFFTADDDTFRLSEKLLELGMIWQWRANKGLPYAEDMQNYEKKLSQLMDDNGGSKPIISGHPQRFYRKGIWAFPATVGQ